MQVQIFGSCGDLQEALLRLRAAGCEEPRFFADRETVVYQVPAQQGAIHAQARLTQLPKSANSEREPTHVLLHEAEIKVDPDKVTRLCAVDRVEVTGEAEKVLSHLNFKEEFKFTCTGFICELKDGWEVEVFQLNVRDKKEIKRVKINTDKPGPFPAIIRSPIFTDERQANTKIAEAKRLLRRLVPDFTAVPALSVFTADSNAK